MDFGSLLHVAKRNSLQDQKAESSKFYPAKFSAPKKESKEKKLSANIQKFLQKREEEERQKALLAKKKVEELMAMRDEKAKNKIKKMLKVTKSANKSVLEDAIDNDNTAITLQGPEQPDEDDYGYTSTEASQLYRNLMDKYKKVPEEKKFSDRAPAKKTDLLGTKDRVRAAIQREQEEENGPHRRKRTVEPSSSRTDEEKPAHRRKNLYDPEMERREEEQRKREEQKAKLKSRPPPPPALNFNQLLKLAEQKQHEPVEIEVETKPKEAERLLTKKEKREWEERQRFFAEKDRRKQNRPEPEKNGSKGSSQNGPPSEPRKMEPNGRIPKIGSKPAPVPQKSTQDRQLNGDSKHPSENRKISSQPSKDDRDRKTEFRKPNAVPSLSSSQSRPGTAKPLPKAPRSEEKIATNNPQKTTTTSREFSSKDARKPLAVTKDSKSNNGPRDRPQIDAKKTATSQNNNNIKTREFPPADVKTKKVPLADVKTRQFPPADVKTRQFPPADVKTRQFPPADLKTRQFPPADVRTRQFPPADVRRPVSMKKPMKRRLVIDDDDSEYDSEMDDFIDDGPDQNDYSKYIQEIFGYDKSKYRGMDDDVDNMESSFAQQMREEYVSKKIGNVNQFSLQIKEQATTSLQIFIIHYREDPDQQNLIDWIQEDWLQCCGIEGPKDWDSNNYFNCSSRAVGSREACGVPFSCCKRKPHELIKNKQCGYDVRREGHILGICFAQNLRADIFAQKAKWH
ncbi:Protein SPT2 like [Pseudolycoriella hygida]|uniref:Protein SPT2 homolog n=1 Tax=Pseudolycoriella hygida TaxID=35572 RepID=A0A9Q0MUQ1_9DIPT|nr:Protein SPT2 like [Pseudolycoriella hygida]